MKVLHQGGKKGREVHEGAVRWRSMIKLEEIYTERIVLHSTVLYTIDIKMNA